MCNGDVFLAWNPLLVLFQGLNKLSNPLDKPNCSVQNWASFLFIFFNLNNFRLKKKFDVWKIDVLFITIKNSHMYAQSYFFFFKFWTFLSLLFFQNPVKVTHCKNKYQLNILVIIAACKSEVVCILTQSVKKTLISFSKVPLMLDVIEWRKSIFCYDNVNLSFSMPTISSNLFSVFQLKAFFLLKSKFSREKSTLCINAK